MKNCFNKKGEKYMEMNVKTGTYFYNDEFYTFSFYTGLSSANKLKFVNSVVSLLVDETHYNSIIRDLIFDYYTIKIFTTVDTEELDNSPNFINDIEDFLLSTNIVEIVKANAFPTLFDELNDAVDKSIQYLTGIHPSPLSDALYSLLSTLEKKINDVNLDSMMDMAQKFSNMTDGFTVDNIVAAYMDSDVHKKNIEEIAEVKKNYIEIVKNLDNVINEVDAETEADAKTETKPKTKANKKK